MVDKGNALVTSYLYTGRRFDDETGNYQYRHRYYHAQLGRFVSRDPIAQQGSKWNLFEYVESSERANGSETYLRTSRPTLGGSFRASRQPRHAIPQSPPCLQHNPRKDRNSSTMGLGIEEFCQ